MSLNKIKKRELILLGAHSLIFGGVLQKSVHANNQHCLDDAFTPGQVEGPFFCLSSLRRESCQWPLQKKKSR